MYKIVQDEQVGKYRLMSLENKAVPLKKYNRFKIGENVFDVVPVLDMPGFFAIESTESHLGKYMEFIWAE